MHIYTLHDENKVVANVCPKEDDVVLAKPQMILKANQMGNEEDPYLARRRVQVIQRNMHACSEGSCIPSSHPKFKRTSVWQRKHAHKLAHKPTHKPTSVPTCPRAIVCCQKVALLSIIFAVKNVARSSGLSIEAGSGKNHVLLNGLLHARLHLVVCLHEKQTSQHTPLKNRLSTRAGQSWGRE